MLLFKRASVLCLVVANLAAVGVLLSAPADAAASGWYCETGWCHCYYGGFGGPPGCYDQAAQVWDCHHDENGQWCAEN